MIRSQAIAILRIVTFEIEIFKKRSNFEILKKKIENFRFWAKSLAIAGLTGFAGYGAWFTLNDKAHTIDDTIHFEKLRNI